MKSVEFGEEMLSDKDALASRLFYDENDPRSTAYKREIIRPAINWWLITINVAIPLALSSAICFMLLYLRLPPAVCVRISLAVLAVYILIAIKPLTICLIKIYQRYAPEGIRNKCRFEPSCSSYMILAIEKYGYFKGIAKGIARLKRCNIHGGGYDEP